MNPEDIKCGEDLLKLPVLTKEEYRDWISRETKDVEKFKDWFSGTTTGSTGFPLQFFSLPKDRAAEIANLFRCALIQNNGYHVLRDRIFSAMNSNPGPFKRLSIPYNRQMNGATTSSEDLIKAYNECKPDFFYGVTSTMLLMAEYALEHNIQLHKAKCAGTTAEMLNDNSREVIASAFGEAAVFDFYGCKECGNVAAEKHDQPGRYVLWNDTHIFNLINVEDVPEHPERKRGQLAISSLVHYGFPMINYVIGDTVEIEEVNGIKVITNILGRSNDLIKNQDGTTYPWGKISFFIKSISKEFPEIIQFRVIQKTYEELVFVLASDVDDIRHKEVEDSIRQGAFLLFDGDNPATRKHISFEWCRQIPLDSTGKIRMFICEIE